MDRGRIGGSESGALTARAVLYQLPDGDAGTAATVAHLRAIARAGAGSPLVQRLAATLAAGWGASLRRPLPLAAMPAVIRDWLALHTLYMDDLPNFEVVTFPENLVRDQLLPFGRIAADCDDIATLAAALGLALGLRARFLVVEFEGQAGFGHIWTALAVPGGEWVDCDPTRPETTSPVVRAWAREV